MALHKTGTKKLTGMGHPTLQMQKGVWGYYVTDNRYRKQRGTPCSPSVKEALKLIEDGRRPQELASDEPVKRYPQ